MSFSTLDLHILKTLISNKKHSADFANEYDAKLFEPDIWNFATLILSYIKTYKDTPTKRVIIEKLGKTNNKLIDYVENVWKEIDSVSYDDREYKFDLERLKKRYAEKELLELKDKLAGLEVGRIDVNKQLVELQKVTQNVKALNQVKSYERKTLKDSVGQFKEEYNAKMDNPTFDKGLLTGYSFLDHATDGLRPGELLLIGAESGGGKSMLLMNMAIQLWMQNNTIDMESEFTKGIDVLYFSLEMPFKPTLNRVMSRLANVPSQKIRNAKLNQEDMGRIKKALKFIKNYPNQFEIIDIPRGATMEAMEQMFEDAKSQFNPKVVVIDYLGLMDYDGGKDMDDWLKLGKIAEKIHEFARVHNIIVLSAVQLNRIKAGKESEDAVGMHRIGRSALVIMNANIALQLIKHNKNEDLHSCMEYAIIKNRDGMLGKGRLIKNLKCATLIDERYEPDTSTYDLYSIDDISEKLEKLE